MLVAIQFSFLSLEKSPFQRYFEEKGGHPCWTAAPSIPLHWLRLMEVAVPQHQEDHSLLNPVLEEWAVSCVLNLASVHQHPSGCLISVLPLLAQKLQAAQRAP